MVSGRAMRLVPFAVPLRHPVTTAYGSVRERRGAILVLEDGDGRRGLGEVAPHPADPPRTLAEAGAALAAAASWLVGADLSQLDALLARATELPRAAASAVDMALHDLAARATERTVAELLGGAVRTAVPASATLAGGSDAECVAAARDALARGFATAKLKVGPDAAGAIARVAAVRSAVPALSLRADANGAWDAAAAVRVARALAAYGLDWLEQPVPAGDLDGLARVRREGGVAVAADESVTGPDAVARLAALGAADVVVLKLVQVGGLARARATAAAAAAHGLAVTVTTAFDTGVGTAAALHLAAALRGELRPCGVATGWLLAGDVVTPAIADGPAMAPPPGPGLGVDLDAGSLARWRLDDAA
jgi:o-succinylbenzoate synthase